MTKYEMLVAKINELGHNEFVAKIKSEGRKWIMEHCGANAGEFSKNLRKANDELNLGMTFVEGREKAESSDGEKPVRTRKPKGVLPKRIETWLIGKARDAFVELGNDADDFEGVEITPEYVENYVLDDTPAWNILMGKIAKGEEEFSSFENWLGDYATLNRRHELGATKALESAKPKIAKLLVKAMNLAPADSALQNAIIKLIYDHNLDESESE